MVPEKLVKLSDRVDDELISAAHRQSVPSFVKLPVVVKVPQEVPSVRLPALVMVARFVSRLVLPKLISWAPAPVSEIFAASVTMLAPDAPNCIVPPTV